MRVSTTEIGDNQDIALRRLAELIRDGQQNPRVIALARKIVNDCPSRDDECELRAIYNAVKHGDPLTKELAKGMKYRSDPKTIDFFAGAGRLLSMCEAGACGADCDEHTILNASLAGSIGFTVGARAYGQTKVQGDPYVHVYAVALTPKAINDPRDPNAKHVALDTTVPKAYAGWQPPPGHYRTAWVLDEE